MDGLIQPGDTLRMERAGALLTVEKRIGEGGQGVVHAARLNGAPFAVKRISGIAPIYPMSSMRLTVLLRETNVRPQP